MDKAVHPQKWVLGQRNLQLLIFVIIIGTMVTSLWAFYTPNTLLGKVDAVGYAVCHRIPSHSITIEGRPMPLCARCSGMYLGALFGTVYQMIIGKRRGGFNRKALILLCVFVLFFVIDGINSFMGLVFDHPFLYDSQNWLRMVTGMSVGLLISVVLYPIFNQTVWQTWKTESALDRSGALVGLLSGSIVLAMALLSGITAILYSLAILSVLGILVILSLIYSVLLLILLKQENRYNHFIELVPTLLAGFVLTIIQIGLFDLMRYFLTRTWNGLPL